MPDGRRVRTANGLVVTARVRLALLRSGEADDATAADDVRLARGDIEALRFRDEVTRGADISLYYSR